MLTDNMERDIYHAWMRQQLGIREIEDGDFDHSLPFMDHQIKGAMDRPTERAKIAYQAFVDAMASEVAHHKDGAELNKLRQHAGKGYREMETREYVRIRQEDGLPEVFFVYHSYAGGGTPDEDWTVRYNGVLLMGHFTFHLSEESRHDEMHDSDTGERWPEAEIQPIDTAEALYHLLRKKQFMGTHNVLINCGRDECEEGIGSHRCTHHVQGQDWFDKEYRRFTEWREEWKRVQLSHGT